MKYIHTLFATATVAILATGCVKPAQQQVQSTQPVYTDPQQPVYEDASPIVYEDPNAVTTTTSSVDYNQIPTDNTVITTTGTTSYPTTSYPTTSTPTYPQPAATSQPVYTNPYETGGANSYPDPYANGGGASQPAATSYPASTGGASSGQGGGGIHLQVAALKDYYAAEQFKNSLSLAPGQSAYVQKGPVNKVIVTGISSVAEANQLKNSRFPGAFIVQGGSMSGGGYTPEPSYEPSYNTGGGTTYTVNDPYGSPSSSGGSYSSGGGIGVQIGAYSSRTKAQEVANMQHGQHPAVVKKIGRYYKVILTGFRSRSAAKSYINSRGKGFVVSF